MFNDNHEEARKKIKAAHYCSSLNIKRNNHILLNTRSALSRWKEWSLYTKGWVDINYQNTKRKKEALSHQTSYMDQFDIKKSWSFGGQFGFRVESAFCTLLYKKGQIQCTRLHLYKSVRGEILKEKRPCGQKVWGVKKREHWTTKKSINMANKFVK